MSGTRRRTRVHQSETWRFTDEVVAIYREMKLRPRDAEWQRLHNQLVDLLGTPPDFWPIIFHPNEGFQTELQALLDQALLERNEVDPVRYS